MNEFYAEIIICVMRIIFAIVGIVLTSVLVPWLKNDFIPWTKEKHLYGLVRKFVLAAEKLGETIGMNGTEKKKYVIELLKAKGYALNPELDAFIEGAVREMDMAFSGYMDDIADVFDDEDSVDAEDDDMAVEVDS